MTYTDTNPFCETLDLAWDDGEDIRDLICTTPLCFDADGLPSGYEASQLFGRDAAHLGGRW